MFDVEALIAKTDLRDLVAKAGGELKNGRCACPIHGGHDETGFAIYHENERDLWKCFSGDCGSGDAISFVMAWRGWEFKRACEFLGGEVQSDPVEMKRLADERMARSAIELADKQARHEAAIKELRTAQLHLHYHETMQEWGRDMWTKRGLDIGWQNFYTLGACDDFDLGGYHTPTLTIPILNQQRQLLNIKHRLINPQKPTDKYRPERKGLGAFPNFYSLPELGNDGSYIVVMEGEIKAMVVWSRLNEIDIQVIGVPGRTQFRTLIEPLKGRRNVVVIPDPGAEKDALEFAKSVGAKSLSVPDKIDDFILATDASSNSIYAMLKQSRKV